MGAILSRHPTLAEISKRNKNFIHESLIAVANLFVPLIRVIYEANSVSKWYRK